MAFIHRRRESPSHEERLNTKKVRSVAGEGGGDEAGLWDGIHTLAGEPDRLLSSTFSDISTTTTVVCTIVIQSSPISTKQNDGKD